MSYRLVSSSSARAAFLALAASTVLAAVHAGCGGDSNTSTTTTSGSGGGGTTTTTTTSSSTTSGTGGASSSSSSTTTSSSSSSTTTSSSSSSGTGGSGGTTGTGGAGGSGGGWPTCDAPEPGAVQKTLHQIWQDNPTTQTEVWVPGVYVTGVSKGGCQAGVPCQIFVQSSETFADLAAGSQQALKIFISANTATHFVGVKAGDKVDVDAFAWRYDVNMQSELLLQVNLQYKGCAKVVGSGNPQPVTVQLSDLSLDAYENTVGPLFVKVNGVSGKPAMPAETFGLWKTGTFSDAGPDTIVSLSPYFLATGAFNGLAQQGHVYDFTSVTGVFGLFSPTSDPTAKYKEIYPRVDAEYPVMTVH